MKLGFHASHEQFPPSRLLDLVKRAEQAGFSAILSSDHFHPWSDLQGESGFAWSWLGAAMQATQLEFGVVNAPGQRYHPAIIAQAAATLDEMFPGRFWLCAGSGQALNEHITGDKWPAKDVRNSRLKESVDLMRKLWKSEDYLTHRGQVTLEDAKLFTKPKTAFPVYGAALTSKTAAWLADWADGLITISKPLEALEKTVKAFKSQAADKPMVLKVQVSYAQDVEQAREAAWRQWKNNIFPSHLIADIDTPAQFDAMGEKVRKEDLEQYVIIGNDPEHFTEKIASYARLGFEKVIIHNVNTQQEEAIQFFEKQVIPNLKQ